MSPMYKIYIIEDHSNIRTAYHQIFRRESDLEICGEASTGAEALDQLPLISPNMILLDLSLPDMSGIELLKRLRKSYPALPILIVTGQEESIYQTLSSNAGASGYLQKSHVAARLVETVWALLNVDASHAI